jgi:hypothetical protein
MLERSNNFNLLFSMFLWSEKCLSNLDFALDVSCWNCMFISLPTTLHCPKRASLIPKVMLKFPGCLVKHNAMKAYGRRLHAFFWILFVVSCRWRMKETMATTTLVASSCPRWQHCTRLAWPVWSVSRQCWCSTAILWWTARSSSAHDNTASAAWR